MPRRPGGETLAARDHVTCVSFGGKEGRRDSGEEIFVSAGVIVTIVVVVVVVILLLAIFFAMRRSRARRQEQQRERTREEFGSEYERTAREKGSEEEAEKELRRRRGSVERNIEPLSAERRARGAREGGAGEGAEKELGRRRGSVERNIEPLSDERREHFEGQWGEVERVFVDNPERSIEMADRTVSDILHERRFVTDSSQSDGAPGKNPAVPAP